MTGLLLLLRGVPSWCYGVIGLLALVVGIELHGRHHVQVLWDADVVAKEAQAETLRLSRQGNIDRVSSKLQAKVTKARVVVKTIIKEIDHYVPITDPVLSSGFRLLHDAAATGEAPDDTRRATSTPVTSATVARTITDNYSSCNYDKQRLEALQEIVKSID